MSKKSKIILSWILVFIWMSVIFYSSNMNGIESTSKSQKVVGTVITKAIETGNKIGITDKKPNQEEIKKVSKRLDFPFRKFMHASVYFILTLLLFNAFYQSGVRNKRIYIYSIVGCSLYAISDEFHQSFTTRSPQITDVLIDTIGGLLSLILIKIIKKTKIKRKN